jgi:methionyl-tRNA formyltransferase
MEKQKLLIITQADPIYLPVFFESFLRSLDRKHFDVQQIIITRPLGNKKIADLGKRVLNLYGWVGILKLVKYLIAQRVKTFFARLGGNRLHCTIQGISNDYGISVIRMDGLNSKEALSSMGGSPPDWIVSVAASERFGAELLSLPTLGCVNIHSGRLPKYRGMMPTFWQMANTEKVITITVHRMTTKFDEGDIVSEMELPITDGETLHELIVRSKVAGGEFFANVLSQLYLDPLATGRKPEGEKCYFSFPTREAVEKFRAAGYRVV